MNNKKVRVSTKLSSMKWTRVEQNVSEAYYFLKHSRPALGYVPYDSLKTSKKHNQNSIPVIPRGDLT